MPACAFRANPRKKPNGGALSGRLSRCLPPTTKPRFLILVLFVFLADRAAKAAAVHFLSSVGSVPILPGFFHLTLVYNTGVAFGLLKGYGLLVTALMLVLLAGLSRAAWNRGQLRDRTLLWALGLILGGALGNLLDRVRLGAVIDFLDFRIWPVFNVADGCITLGAVVMGWTLWRRR